MGVIVNHSGSVFLYYYVFESVIAVQFAYFVVSGVLIFFNSEAYCTELNSEMRKLYSFFQGDAEVNKDAQDLTIQQCRNLAIVILAIQIIFCIVCFYLASRVYTYAEELVDRQTRTRRSVDVVRVERDLELQTKI